MRLVTLSMVVLVAGCGRPNNNDSAGQPVAAPDAGVLTRDVVQLEPVHRFQIPGELRGDDALAFSADGTRLAVATASNKTQVWEVTAAPRLVQEFKGGTFVLFPSGKQIMFSDLTQPEVYDVESGKQKVRLNRGYAFAVARDESTVVMASPDYGAQKVTAGQLRLWDVSRNAEVGVIELADNRFHDAKLTKSGKELWVFLRYQKFEVECYDLDTKKLIRTIKPEQADPAKPYADAGIYNSVSPDASVFAATVQFKTVVFDADSGKIVSRFPSDIHGSATGFLSNGTRYLGRTGDRSPAGTGLPANSYVVYDWKARRPLALLKTGAEENSMPAVASPDGKKIVVVSKTKGTACVFDVSALK